MGNEDGHSLPAENPPLEQMHITAGNPQLGTWLNMGPGAHYAAQPRQALDDQIWLYWEKDGRGRGVGGRGKRRRKREHGWGILPVCGQSFNT